MLVKCAKCKKRLVPIEGAYRCFECVDIMINKENKR